MMGRNDENPMERTPEKNSQWALLSTIANTALLFAKIP